MPFPILIFILIKSNFCTTVRIISRSSRRRSRSRSSSTRSLVVAAALLLLLPVLWISRLSLLLSVVIVLQ